MKIGSLFSGAGGLDLAVEQVFGGRTVWHCEVDPAASKVLEHRWPGVPNYGDVKSVAWGIWKQHTVEVLCGGFPCQDISSAGKQAGMGVGTRSGLWSEFARAIKILRPRYVVIENVRNLLSVKANRDVESGSDALGDNSTESVLRGLGAVFGDLSDLGFDASWTTVPASAVGAPHRRERVFILATATDAAGCRRAPTEPGPNELQGASVHVAGNGSGARDLADLLPTPRASRGGARGPDYQRRNRDGSGGDDLITTAVEAVDTGTWGKYAAAIQRWEGIAGPVPQPTEPNSRGNPRLSSAFSEWMMGWPRGWVTDQGIGISRNDQLRIIGNGVVPQQAYAALTWLLGIAEAAA